jgi:hypothetical protein
LEAASLEEGAMEKPLQKNGGREKVRRDGKGNDAHEERLRGQMAYM